MKTLAIIPARGGSKRIERKNVKEFCGVPVIAYSVRAAVAAGCFDAVMVSTDDEEIASMAEKYGASVPFMRSAETSDDFATTADVIREVLVRYEALGEKFDAIACIYATAPFVTAERLRSAWELLKNGSAQAAFTCVEYSYPVQRGLEIGEDGRIRMRHPEYAKSRSQDLQPTYHDAGQFYLSTVDSFMKCGSLWGADTRPIVLSELEVQDLDTPTDWRMAELKYKMLSFPEHFLTRGYEFRSYTVLSESESMRLLAERNAPEVRRMMINREEISEESHKSFVESLKFRREKIYYAVYSREDAKLVGSVNFERLAPECVERGIWVAADMRGHGHASALLDEAYRYLKRERGVERVLTTVRFDNAASQALELRLGAEALRTDSLYIYYELKL